MGLEEHYNVNACDDNKHELSDGMEFAVRFEAVKT